MTSALSAYLPVDWITTPCRGSSFALLLYRREQPLLTFSRCFEVSPAAPPSPGRLLGLLRHQLPFLSSRNDRIDPKFERK